MADNEIDSFVQKFKLLRGAGIEASLNIETKLGEVSISLNCKVGRNIPPPPPIPKLPSVPASKVYRSPSYYRRQVRRKAEREAGRESSSTDKAKIEETPKMAKTCIEEDKGDDTAKDDSDSNVEDTIGVMSNGRMEETEEVIVDTDDDDDDLSLQLQSIIKQSQENRDLWEKSKVLPP